MGGTGKSSGGGSRMSFEQRKDQLLSRMNRLADTAEIRGRSLGLRGPRLDDYIADKMMRAEDQIATAYLSRYYQNR